MSELNKILSLEKKELRNLNSKFFDCLAGHQYKKQKVTYTQDGKVLPVFDVFGNPEFEIAIVEYDGQFRQMDAHSGHIHYFDKLDSKQIREIDWTLIFDEVKRGWYFNFHSFRPFLPEYADEWVEFRDLFQDKDQTIKYKAVCSHVKGRLAMPDEIGLKDTNVNCVIYDNAFGEGMDYILYFTRSTLKKVIRIRNGFKPNNNVQFKFEINLPIAKDVKRGYSKDNVKYNLDRDNSKRFDTDKLTLIGDDFKDGKEWNTYLMPFFVWDSAEIKKFKSIAVDYLVENGKTYLVKNITKEYLDNSVGDVYTDTTTTYYPHSNDGVVYFDGVPRKTWPNLVAADANGVSKTSASDRVFLVQRGSATTPYWETLERAIFSFDTSGIGSTATISAASFFLRGESHGDTLAITPNLNIYIATPASYTDLALGDFKQIGTSAISSAIAYSSFSISGYNEFAISSPDTNVSKTSYTSIGTRNASYDVANSEPSTSNTGLSYMNAYFSEQTGTGSDPYLSVTYSTGTNYNQSVSDTVTLADALSKTVNKPIAEALTLVESLGKTDNKTLTESNPLADNIKKDTQKNVVETIQLVESLIKAISKNTAESLNINDIISTLKSFYRSLTENTPLTDGIIKQISSSIFDAVSANDSIIKESAFNRQLIETLAISEIIRFGTEKFLTDAIGLLDALVSETGKGVSLSDGFLVVETISNIEISKGISEGININDSLSREVSYNLSIQTALQIAETLIKRYDKSLTDALSIAERLTTEKSSITQRLAQKVIVTSKDKDRIILISNI